ncbi:hypothetical protein M2401_000670 [Pseudomonas sp. JUb42]|nr:hypothetical protein [Pseudomonas sp. JUb42]
MIRSKAFEIKSAKTWLTISQSFPTLMLTRKH